MRKAKTALAVVLTLCLSGGPAAASSEAPAENTAPVAENLELETYRGVSVGGQLTAYDAEGDEVTFTLETEPLKGSVDLSPDGFFVYTPGENRRGRDYFGFRVTDAAGNASQEGTVIIRLVKQKTRAAYADMEGDPLEYAAVALTEAGVFTGEGVGTVRVFSPDALVSRGEFLSMCMNAAGCELLQGVKSTGFQDDDAIAPWLKPYVATALLRGYIQGSSTETGAVFRPEDPVTLRDACVMLNAVLGVTDVVSASAMAEDGAVSRDAQAVANLTSSRVMPARWEDLDESLTRGQAAELLQNAMDLLSRR